jgi:hypothetical protein
MLKDIMGERERKWDRAIAEAGMTDIYFEFDTGLPLKIWIKPGEGHPPGIKVKVYDVLSDDVDKYYTTLILDTNPRYLDFNRIGIHLHKKKHIDYVLDFAIRNRDFLTKYHYHKGMSIETFLRKMRKLVAEDVEAGRYPEVTTRREKDKKLKDLKTPDSRRYHGLRIVPMKWIYLFIHSRVGSLLEPYHDCLECIDKSHMLCVKLFFEFGDEDRLGPPMVRVPPFKPDEDTGSIAVFKKRFIKVALIGNKAVITTLRRGSHTKDEWNTILNFIERHADTIRNAWTRKIDLVSDAMHEMEVNELKHRMSVGVLAPNANMRYRIVGSERFRRKGRKYDRIMIKEEVEEKAEHRWDIKWRIKRYTEFHKHWIRTIYWDI